MDNSARFGLFCLAYILGLIVGSHLGWGCVVAGLFVGGIYVARKFWRQRILLTWPWQVAIVAMLFAASFYGQARLPQLANQDISVFVNSLEGRGIKQFSTVRGVVDSYPRITRSGRSQFWITANQLSQIQSDDPSPSNNRSVNGRLYVTAPVISATGLKPGVQVVITGTLYKPQPSLNPGGLNFADYLARSGTFAGMRASQLLLTDEEQIRTWDITTIRQRVVAAQVRWLDVPVGPLVSAMALGDDAVDLPFEVKDSFVRVGLAHALAASGFQVSLIVTIIINFTQRWLSKKWQFGWGIIGIGVFVAMAGVQPSVLRAAVMGVAVLVGLLTARQLRPLNSLLLAAVLLLLIEPLWIWDVGFQLSFLATLGLVVSVTPLQKKLDFLPPTIAAAIALPLAATIWTMPIQLWTFKVLPLYALITNVIAAPLVTVISIGGMLSAMVGMVFPWGGSAMAWLLLYPTKFLMAIVSLFGSMPGANVAVGSIRLWQLILLYALILLVWQLPLWQKRWPLVLLIAVLLIGLPLMITKSQEFKITALAAREERILVIERGSRTIVIDAGDSSIARFTVLPFLTSEAVNNIDWAVALQNNAAHIKGWQTLQSGVSINKLFHLPQQQWQIAEIATTPLSQSQDMAGGKARLLLVDPPILELEIDQQRWLIGGDMQVDHQRDLSDKLQPVQALYWSGGMLTDKFIQTIRPQVAIAATNTPDPETIQNLEKLGAKVFLTGRDGAVQWTAGQGFHPLLGSD
jgi:competence protein ComEC